MPREVEAKPADAADTRPPLGRPETPPALIGALSYSALSGYENCGYRFYVERVLGIAEPDAPSSGSGEAPPGGAPSLRTGVAVHALLEWSARNRWREPDPKRAASALREQGLEGDEETAHALGLVRGFLGSPLREEIGDARVSAEVPFVLSVRGTMIQGSIDLLVERPDGSALVVDYKTDRLEETIPARSRGVTRCSGTSTRSPPRRAARRLKPPTCSWSSLGPA